MSENAVDVIKLGIEYIMLAIFLLFVGQVIQIRNSYAVKLNTREAQESAANETLEYSMYNTGDTAPDQNGTSKFSKECLSGDEVLACIRNYADGSINIYVDGVKQGNDSRIIDGRMALTGSMATDMTTKDMFTEKYLSDHIYLDEQYHPYLIYDDKAVPFDADTKVKNASWYSGGAYDQTGEAVTGLAFIRYKE